jgi:hypothetical protein
VLNKSERTEFHEGLKRGEYQIIHTKHSAGTNSQYSGKTNSGRRAHREDVDKLIELLDDLPQHLVRPGDDDGEEGLVLVEPHGERLDVVASPGEDPGDPVDHAALIPDEH